MRLSAIGGVMAAVFFFLIGVPQLPRLAKTLGVCSIMCVFRIVMKSAVNTSDRSAQVH
jgi:hypothetical protein